MDDILQHLGTVARLILKILFVLVVIRILIFALGLKIVEYIPVIDDIINLMFKGMMALAKGGESLLGSVVRM